MSWNRFLALGFIGSQKTVFRIVEIKKKNMFTLYIFVSRFCNLSLKRSQSEQKGEAKGDKRYQNKLNKVIFLYLYIQNPGRPKRSQFSFSLYRFKAKCCFLRQSFGSSLEMYLLAWSNPDPPSPHYVWSWFTTI